MTKKGVVQALQAPSTRYCPYINWDDARIPFSFFFSFSVTSTDVSSTGLGICGRMKNKLDF